MQRRHATLVIAKLDRLSRKVSFVSNLMDSGVRFIAVDNRSANQLTIKHPSLQPDRKSGD